MEKILIHFSNIFEKSSEYMSLHLPDLSGEWSDLTFLLFYYYPHLSLVADDVRVKLFNVADVVALAMIAGSPLVK